MEYIEWNDFEKIDIRVGKLISVSDFPEANIPAYKLTIDFGELGIRKSSARITKLYSKEQLLNKQIIAVVNFKPKQVANFMSECLVLGVYREDHSEVVLLQPEREMKVGAKVG